MGSADPVGYRIFLENCILTQFLKILPVPLETKCSELYSEKHAVNLNNDISNADHITLNDWIIVNNKMERLWKEMIMA
jgi:hypothetical protein